MTEAQIDPPAHGPHIEWMMLADYAEAQNGKVTVVGGGFDRVTMADFSVPHVAYLAAGLKVPWEDTNRRITLNGSLETVDGEALPWSLSGQMEAGRPPGLRGQSVTMNIAFPVEFLVPGPGQVVLTLEFGDHRRRTVVTLVSAMPNFPNLS